MGVGRRRILLVDDEEPIAFLAARVLTKLGYTVRGHTSAVHALAELRTDPMAWDVLVTDVAMPEMTGFELAAAAHALRPDLVLILTSGSVDTGDRDAAHSHGLPLPVPKPQTIQEYARMIDDRLRELEASRR